MRKELFLKSIRIKNFKSYKNLTEAGPFHPKINIIVGPNGTGKSNFLDSILFVLGKRAGQLRFRKLSDMINLKNIKKNRFGSVSLLFSENLKNFINRKELFSEIVFSRQVFHDNLSYYYLNGKEISFFNLINSLKVIGICVKNDRFLIQQGEIEKISQMKSKNGFSSEVGMLEYTEDSFGSSRYLKDLNKKKKKIFKLEKLRKTALKNRKLKRDFSSRKHKIFKKLKILFILKNNILRKKWETICRKILIKEKIQDINTFLKFINTKIDFLEKKHQFNEKKIINIKLVYFFGKFIKVQIHKIFNKIKKKIFDLKKEKKEIQKKKKKRRIQRDSEKLFLNQKIYFFKLNEYRKKCESTSLVFFGLQKFWLNFFKYEDYLVYSSKKVNQFLSLYNQKILFRDEIFEREKYERISLILKKKMGFNGVFGLKYFLLSNSYKYSFLGIKNIFLNQNFHSIIFFKKKIRKFFFFFNPDIFSYKTDFSIFFFSRMKFLAYSATFNSKNRERIKIPNYKKNFIFNTLNNLKKKIMNLSFIFLEENKKILISAKFSPQEKHRDDYKKISKTKKFKKFDVIKKNVPGIMGTVGTLGFVKFYYSVSFFSFLIGSFSTILIDTCSNCSKAIEFLQKNKIGRNIFLVYEKLRKYNVSKTLFGEKRYINFINLLYCERKFKSIFYNILGDTILVKNLTEAINLSKKSLHRKRMITLDGKQVEMSGIFSGGGLIRNITAFLRPAEKKNFLWIKKIENLFRQSRFSNEFVKNYKFNLIKYPFKNWNVESLQLFTSFSYFLKLFSQIYRNHRIQKIEKNTNLGFKKKVIFLENKRYVNCAFYRKINIGTGKFFHFLLINEKKNELPQICSSSFFSDNFFNHIHSNLESLFKDKKKISLKKIDQDLIFIKYFGKIVKKNYKIIKFLETFYIFLIIVLLRKKFEFAKFFSIGGTVINLKKEEWNKFNKTLKSENFKKFEQIKKIRLETKSNFFFFFKFKKLKNFQDNREIPPRKEMKFREILLIYLFCSIFQKKKNKEKIPFFCILGLEKRICPNFACYVKIFRHSFFFKSEKFNFKKLFQGKTFLSKCNHYTHLQRYTEYLLDIFAFDMNIKKIFPKMSNGGIMEVNMIDFTDPFTEGVSLSIKPSQKTWRFISFLSGGEKTLSSLAVVFSIQTLKPTSWYLLDEIDAALDFKNVSKVSIYLLIQSTFCQIFIVSLRNNILAKAIHIIGVFRIFSGTRIISYRK